MNNGIESGNSIVNKKTTIVYWLISCVVLIISCYFIFTRPSVIKEKVLSSVSKTALTFSTNLSESQISAIVEGVRVLDPIFSKQLDGVLNYWNLVHKNGFEFSRHQFSLNLKKNKVTAYQFLNDDLWIGVEIKRFQYSNLVKILSDVPGNGYLLFYEGDRKPYLLTSKNLDKIQPFEKNYTGSLTLLLFSPKAESIVPFNQKTKPVHKFLCTTNEAVKKLLNVFPRNGKEDNLRELPAIVPGGIAAYLQSSAKIERHNWLKQMKAVQTSKGLVEWSYIGHNFSFSNRPAFWLLVLSALLPVLCLLPLSAKGVFRLLKFSGIQLFQGGGLWRLSLMALPPFLWGCVGVYSITLPYSWPFRAFTRFFLGGLILLGFGMIVMVLFYLCDKKKSLSDIEKKPTFRKAFNNTIWSFFKHKGNAKIGHIKPSNLVCTIAIGFMVYSVSLLFFFIGFDNTGTAFTNVVGLGFLPVIFYYIEWLKKFIRNKNVILIKEPEPVTPWTFLISLLCLIMVIIFWSAYYGGLRFIDISRATDTGIVPVIIFGLSWAVYLKMNGHWMNNDIIDDPGLALGLFKKTGLKVIRSVFKAGIAMFVGSILMIPTIYLTSRLSGHDMDMWHHFIFDWKQAFSINSSWLELGLLGLCMVIFSTCLAYFIMFMANNFYDNWAINQKLDFDSDRWDSMLAYVEPLTASILGISILNEPMGEPLLLLPLFCTFIVFLLARLLEGGEQLFQGTKNKRGYEIAQRIFNIKPPFKVQDNEGLLNLWSHELASPWLQIKNGNDKPVTEVYNYDLEKMALEKYLALNHNAPKPECHILKWSRGQKFFGQRTFDFIKRSFEETSAQIYTNLSFSLTQDSEQHYKDIGFDPRVDILLFYFYPVIQKEKLEEASLLKLCLGTKLCFAKKGESNRNGFSEVKIYKDLTVGEIFKNEFPDTKLSNTITNFFEFHNYKNNYIEQNNVYLIDPELLLEGQESGNSSEIQFKQLDFDPGDMVKSLSGAPGKQCYVYAMETRYELISELKLLYVRISNQQITPVPVYNRKNLAEICLQAAYLSNNTSKKDTLLGSKTIKAIFIDDDEKMLATASEKFKDGSSGLICKNCFTVKNTTTIDQIKEILPKNDDETHLVFIDVILFPDNRKLSMKLSGQIYQEVLNRQHLPIYFTGQGGPDTKAVYASRDLDSSLFLPSLRKGMGIHLQKYLNSYFQNKTNFVKISNPEELLEWLNKNLTSDINKECPLEKKTWAVFQP